VPLHYVDDRSPYRRPFGALRPVGSRRPAYLRFRGAGLDRLFRVVSFLGSLEVLALVGVLVAVALLVRSSCLAFAAWLIAVLGGEVLNLLIKDLFARPRPSFERPMVVEISYSFPSGQAMESLVVYGMLTFFVVLTSRAWGKRAVSVGGAAMIVLLIGFSRVYLGAHYGLLAV
jgi:membrane-associated phospholipid phosphatase